MRNVKGALLATGGLVLALALPACGGQTASRVDVSESQAKEIALDHAGITEDDATFTEATLDTNADEGAQQWNIGFTHGNTEYDYDIHAMTGEILAHDQELGRLMDPTVPSNDELISEQVALDAALEHAGLAETDVSGVRSRLEDDTPARYSVEFVAEGILYEYEVDAMTADVISVDAEREEPANS